MAVNANLPALLEGDRIWTRRELEREVQSRSAGLRRGDRVGLIAKPSAAAVIELLACLRAGATLVPLGDRLTDPERERIASTAGIRPPGRSPEVPALHGPPAVIMPTSGTTAEPKLVRLGLAQLDASAAAWGAVLPPATGWLLSLGLAHVSGIGIAYRAFRQNVPLVLLQPDEALPETFERAARHDTYISHISLVASQLRRFLGEGVTPASSLRAVILGGGPLPEGLVAEGLAGGWPLFPSYGLTETASGVVAASPAEATARPWSAGRPMPGVELRIESGEILVRGPMVFEGYEAEPDLTAAALDADGWLHTGDLGTIDKGGWLRVLGRRDDMIISGGENVSPAEVEAALASHPQIADAAVLGRPDDRWGQVPVALVVFRSGPRPADDELRSFARERLASFKVPARFVEVARLPRTTNGKLARRSLPDLLAPAARSPAQTTTTVRTDDGQTLGVRDLAGPSNAPTVLLLHATLSTSGQLMRMAGLLRSRARVVAIDRRGSGASVMASPAPVPIARHVADVVAVLDALAIERPIVFGHSFGAVLALELAARHPDRVESVFAFEPPYLSLADARTQRGHEILRSAMAAHFVEGDAGSAARLFIRAVAGSAYWDRLSATQQAFLEAAGWGALADDSLSGIDPADLSDIRCPVVVARGAASDPFYVPIMEALAARIPDARCVTLPGLGHTAPITDPTAVAELIAEQL